MQTPDWSGRIMDDHGHDRIAACLVLDIQNAPDWARMILDTINDVIAGHKDGWEMAMNAYQLTVGAEQSEIAPVYEEQNEKSLIVATKDLREALIAWIQQIEG